MQHSLDDNDPVYHNIPIVVADTGVVLLCLGDVETTKAAATRRNIKKKLTRAQNALERFKEVYSDANSTELDDDSQTPSKTGYGHAPPCSDIIDEGWMDGNGEVAIAKRHAKDARRRARSPSLRSKDKGKAKARSQGSKRHWSASSNPNSTSKRTRAGPFCKYWYVSEFRKSIANR